MEADVKVLAEIARDKVVVEKLEKAIAKGTLLTTCPFWGTGDECMSVCDECLSGDECMSGDECLSVCGAIWPNPDGATDGATSCPCFKPYRLEIAQAIIALSKLVPKTYRVGDVFGYTGNDLLYIISLIGNQKFALMGLGSNSAPNDGYKCVAHGEGISLGYLTAFPGNYTYLGHISELTIKNGKVVQP